MSFRVNPLQAVLYPPLTHTSDLTLGGGAGGGAAVTPASFTLTAGSIGDPPMVNVGFYATHYGSISNEPLDGFTLDRFSTASGGAVFLAQFLGDCLSIIAGWMPVIAGTPIVGEWAVQAGETPVTYLLITEGVPDMEDEGVYEITWQAS